MFKCFLTSCGDTEPVNCKEPVAFQRVGESVMQVLKVGQHIDVRSQPFQHRDADTGCIEVEGGKELIDIISFVLLMSISYLSFCEFALSVLLGFLAFLLQAGFECLLLPQLLDQSSLGQRSQLAHRYVYQATMSESLNLIYLLQDTFLK